MTAKERAERPIGNRAAPFDAEYLTSPGTMLGTVAYMSPEQVEARELDRGPTCFPSGRCSMRWPPAECRFDGTARGDLRCHSSRRPSHHHSVNSRVSPELEAIIVKALEKDRNLRYQHASEIRTDLQRLKRDTESARYRPVEFERVREPTLGRTMAVPGSARFSTRRRVRLTALGSRRRWTIAGRGRAGKWRWAIPGSAAVVILIAAIAGGLLLPLASSVQADGERHRRARRLRQHHRRRRVRRHVEDRPERFVEPVALPECAAGQQSRGDPEVDGTPGDTQLTPEVASEFASARAARHTLPGPSPAWAANTCWG